MANSIDFYKIIFLHLIPICIIVVLWLYTIVVLWLHRSYLKKNIVLGKEIIFFDKGINIVNEVSIKYLFKDLTLYNVESNYCSINFNLIIS